MNRRALIEKSIARKTHEKNAFWIGHPSAEAKKIYYSELGIGSHKKTELELHNAESSVLLSDQPDLEELEFNIALESDMMWISPELDLSAWKHPEGKPMWDCFPNGRESLNAPGVFANCEDAKEVEKFQWPNPDYLDFSNVVQLTKKAYDKGLAVFGGMWCPFFHVVSDFFGMENYFVKMYTDPDVVHAVTRHVVDFYLETNRRCLASTKEYLSAAFFGNDLGTQISMLIGMDSFDEFIYPYMKEIIAVIKNENLPVAMHSCGAIEPLIPRLIDAGVDILHPLQAKARGMEAENLARKYGGKLTFMGGVDTQELLPFGTPQQVRDEVLHLRDIFQNDFIVSPSHEALLPNVPFENVLAMAKAAKE